MLTEALIKDGYKKNIYDYSIFPKVHEENIIILLVYVDDILRTGSDIRLILELKKILQEKSKIKDLGRLKYFVGIVRFSDGLVMNQRNE